VWRAAPAQQKVTLVVIYMFRPDEAEGNYYRSMSSRRRAIKEEQENAAAVDDGTLACEPVTSWEDVAAAYPSTKYLEELNAAVARAVRPQRGDDILNEAHRWPNDLTRRISHLSPILDEWVGKRQYWYADDIAATVANVTASKIAAVEHLAATPAGARVLASHELAAYERASEEYIDALLNSDHKHAVV